MYTKHCKKSVGIIHYLKLTSDISILILCHTCTNYYCVCHYSVLLWMYKVIISVLRICSFTGTDIFYILGMCKMYDCVRRTTACTTSADECFICHGLWYNCSTREAASVLLAMVVKQKAKFFYTSVMPWKWRTKRDEDCGDFTVTTVLDDSKRKHLLYGFVWLRWFFPNILILY